MNKRLIAILNLVVTVLSIAGIAVISSGATSLRPASQISDQTSQQNLVLPPGFVFSIWSVIYLGFITYSLYQLVKGNQTSDRIQSTRPLVTLSIFLNLVWIVLVGFEAVMIPYFLQWAMLYISVVIMQHAEYKSPFESTIEKFIFITLGLYAGWLTVAMIPFTSDLLLLAGWYGEPLSLEFWAVVLYIIAFVLVFGIYYKRLRFIWYTLPLTWALFGLAVRFYPGVGTVAGALALLGMLMFVQETRKGHA